MPPSYLSTVVRASYLFSPPLPPSCPPYTSQLVLAPQISHSNVVQTFTSRTARLTHEFFDLLEGGDCTRCVRCWGRPCHLVTSSLGLTVQSVCDCAYPYMTPACCWSVSWHSMPRTW